MITLEQVRATFADWARIYDATHAWLPNRKRARLALGIKPGDSVIEIGCGTGLNLPHLSKLAGRGGRVVGVDLTPAMLSLAGNRIAARGLRNVEIYLADAACLPFGDESFDEAFCAFALNIIPDYVQAISEIRRVLVPQGRFVALEMKSINPGSISGWMGNIFHGLMGICSVDPSHKVLETIQDAFEDIKVQRSIGGMFFIYIAVKA